MTGLRTVGGALGVLGAVAPAMLGPDGQWYTAQPYLPRRNLVTNPSFRTAGSTTEVRRNLATNPAAETSAVGWISNNPAVYPATFDTTVKRSGTKSVRCAGVTAQPVLMSLYNVGGGTFAATVGTAYTASVYVAHNAATTASASVQLSFLDSGGGVIQSFTGTAVAAIAGDSQFTARPFVTATAPANSVTFRLIVTITRAAGTVLAGEYGWADDCLIEAAGGLLPYFDGSTAVDATTGWTYAWTGTANASASTWTAPVTPGLGQNLAAYQTNRGGRCLPGDVLRIIQIGPTNAGLYAYHPSSEIVVSPGEFFAGRWQARVVSGVAVSASPRLGFYNASTFLASAGMGANTLLPADGSWVDLIVPAQTAAPAGAVSVRLMMYSVGTTAPGTTVEMRRSMVEKVPAATSTVGPYFDGATAADRDYRYGWAGTVDASASIATP